MTCPTCELLASDTSHLEQVQEWEFQKAELLNALHGFLDLRDWVIKAGGTQGPMASDVIRQFALLQIDVVDRAQAVIRKYEVA